MGAASESIASASHAEGSRLAQGGRHAGVRWDISQARSSRDGPWLVWRTWYQPGQLSKARSKRTTTPSEVTRANSHAPDSSLASSACSARSTLVNERMTWEGRRELHGDGMI